MQLECTVGVDYEGMRGIYEASSLVGSGANECKQEYFLCDDVTLKSNASPDVPRRRAQTRVLLYLCFWALTPDFENGLLAFKN